MEDQSLEALAQASFDTLTMYACCVLVGFVVYLLLSLRKTRRAHRLLSNRVEWLETFAHEPTCDDIAFAEHKPDESDVDGYDLEGYGMGGQAERMLDAALGTLKPMRKPDGTTPPADQLGGGF